MTNTDLKPLQGLDADIRAALLAQIRDLRTHGSTAIEGNTLTLDEIKFVIEEGLTISGKPLKSHQEVMGHARAIELITIRRLEPARRALGPWFKPPAFRRLLFQSGV